MIRESEKQEGKDHIALRREQDQQNDFLRKQKNEMTQIKAMLADSRKNDIDRIHSKV